MVRASPVRVSAMQVRRIMKPHWSPCGLESNLLLPIIAGRKEWNVPGVGKFYCVYVALRGHPFFPTHTHTLRCGLKKIPPLRGLSVAHLSVQLYPGATDFWRQCMD